MGGIGGAPDCRRSLVVLHLAVHFTLAQLMHAPAVRLYTQQSSVGRVLITVCTVML